VSGAGAGGVGGIVLAAGEGRRMGRPKAFITVDGEWLVRRAIDAAAAAGLRPIIAVIGEDAGGRAPAFDAMGVPGLCAVVNTQSRSGQASSLRTGITGMPAGVRAAVVLLADQPTVRADAIRAVVASFIGGAGPVVQASYRGRPAHPTLLARSIWPDLARLRGDAGARQLIRTHPEWRHVVEVGGDPPGDVDTPEDLARWVADRQVETDP
jgi:CTP:molybdopterin cytidylyltransferase MocA